MLDPKQFRELVNTTLKDMEPSVPYSPYAEDLLLMTAAHESRLGTYLVQTRGPAQGVYQMEPATYDDLLDNYLAYRGELRSLLESHFVEWRNPKELSWNLKGATVAARLQYRRVPEKLPDTLEGMAEYAKEHWNTRLGKASAADYLNAYKEAYE